jgi:predicted ABC-type ATPase
MAKNLYIISGCNGAGKTTASYTVLPEILDCREFVNADEIARGLSPFNPESVAIVAGINNLFRLFMGEVDYWAIFDNSETPRKKIAIGGKNADIEIYYHKLYENMKAYVK